MSRQAQNVLLVLVGGMLLRISLGDVFLRYVKDWMQPGLIAAGAVLVLVGLVSIWRERADPADDHAHHDGHGHGSGPWVAWLLLLPVLAILLVAPPALGSYTASRSTAAAVPEPEQSQYEPLPAGEPVTLTLSDYATRVIWEDGLSLQGRELRLVGFVSPRPGGGFYLTRIVLLCCAADGLPIRVAVPAPPRTFPADTWVAVTGTYGGKEPDPKTGDDTPVLAAESVTSVKPPADPYE